MSEWKKSQAGVSVPPTPGWEEDLTHQALTRDISLEDRDRWDLLGSWESPEIVTSHSIDLMRAHKCCRLKDKISLSRDTSLVAKGHWDLLGSWESPESVTSHSIDLMRAHKCLCLKDKISLSRNTSLVVKGHWDLLGSWESPDGHIPLL